MSFIRRSHYLAHKESARAFVLARLQDLNSLPFYNFTYARVSIRNTRTRWGSCSSKKGLNFNYKIKFLPPHLADYIIIHELCHLREMNHSSRFWNLVAQACPEYMSCRKELMKINMRLLK